MAFFENFVAVIRQKWLDYVQANQAWLELQMRQTSVRTPDGGRRPSSFLILGVVNALEPKLGNLMVPFYQLNSDEDALVEVLGLNFDPEMALDNNTVPPTLEAENTDTSDTPLLSDSVEDL
ncbi:MAG: DUF5331 domain-containing protein [Leptolyngbya sp. SIO1E4]|nr:DUF5331 domain-containing protein [Leptolyngbya sp. SIO1E4]